MIMSIEYSRKIHMKDEITINGVVYVRKEQQPNDKYKYKFKDGCQYFTYYSCNPDRTLKELKDRFPNINSFFVGKKGYCGKVCLEVPEVDMNTDFFKKILPVRDFFCIIEDEKTFKNMVDEEMSRPDLH